MTFPNGFLWGAATAAYQIEGAAAQDGKGPSIWDVFCRRRGTVWNGDSGDVACDHYHRFREDVELMRRIGLRAYRFSISWPRVLPEGTGAVNEKGLAFYDQLLDALLAAGIQPFATLFHWDLPYALHCRGGWLNPDSPRWFADYARVLAERLSDRLSNWITLNEPQSFVGLGYLDTRLAPGQRLPIAEALRVGHHALLGHGMAVQALRAAARGACRVGYAPVGITRPPASDKPEDIQASWRLSYEINPENVFNCSWWLDPVLLGRYPEQGLAAYGADAPAVASGDMETIAQPLDFLGLNIYKGNPARMGANGQAEFIRLHEGYPTTSFRWPITPQVLYWGTRFAWERYKLPIYITENGMTNIDWIMRDGKVHDPQRIDFLTRYLGELRRAIHDGVDIRGYFHWSFMDNFEWCEGYRERFGLVYVDYPTQRRVPKDSAEWYSGVIASNGASLESANA